MFSVNEIAKSLESEASPKNDNIRFAMIWNDFLQDGNEHGGRGVVRPMDAKRFFDDNPNFFYIFRGHQPLPTSDTTATLDRQRAKTLVNRFHGYCAEYDQEENEALPIFTIFLASRYYGFQHNPFEDVFSQAGAYVLIRPIAVADAEAAPAPDYVSL